MSNQADTTGTAPRRRRSRRTRLMLRSIVAIIAVAAIVGLTILILDLLNGDGTPDRPSITASAGSTTITVGPYEYCNPTPPEDCDPQGEPGIVPVTPDTPLTITVPSAIADAPWSVTSYYVDPGVRDFDQDSLIPEPTRIFAPGETTETTIDPVDGTGRQLAIVEVALPTMVQNEDTGDLLDRSHASWVIWTHDRPDAEAPAGGDPGSGND